MTEFAIPVVGALIFNDQNELFLMQSSGKFGDEWIVPGGKVHFGERLEAALRREIKEETSLDLGDIKFLGVREMIDGKNHFVFLEYSARPRPPYRVVLNHEAVEYRWFTPDELKAIKMAGPTQELIRERIALDQGFRPPWDS